MVKFDNDVEVSEKELFKKVIVNELGAMKPVLCKFAQDLLNEIPEYFWVESASASGKYHPGFANGEGGLARHSLMAYRWLKTVLTTQDDAAIASISDFVPSMVVACLFHDCCKRGLPGAENTTWTVHEHPILSAKFILDKAEEFAKNNKEFIEMTSDDEDSFKMDISYVVACVETHMGKWTKNKHSTVELPKPRTNIQYLVHLSDYLSSKKFTTFDYDYFKDLMFPKED